MDHQFLLEIKREAWWVHIGLFEEDISRSWYRTSNVSYRVCRGGMADHSPSIARRLRYASRQCVAACERDVSALPPRARQHAWHWHFEVTRLRCSLARWNAEHKYYDESYRSHLTVTSHSLPHPSDNSSLCTHWLKCINVSDSGLGICELKSLEWESYPERE